MKNPGMEFYNLKCGPNRAQGAGKSIDPQASPIPSGIKMCSSKVK